MTKMRFFQAVIEADPLEIKSLLVEPVDTNIGLYGSVLEFYRLGKIEALQDLITKISDPLVLTLAELHLQIRMRQISEMRTSVLERNLNTFDEMWHGEVYFVLAMAAEGLNDQRRAQVLFLKAYRAFEAVGFPKKAVRALLNATTCESRIYPEGKFIPDYQFILQKSLEANENGVAAIALTNISCEYQRLGALNVASINVSAAKTREARWPWFFK
ncbi:MAG: hypothetical protein A4S09_10970 [Proteobacteria bacterium SG_bin7]|nr:MAG: hypothetical protein A4S09_10970 [Proteobacteria bacterium SG_bin7]